MQSLENKTVIVTGASQGIGAAVAKAFAASGANVVVHFRSSLEAANAVVAEIADRGQSACAVRAALDDEEDVQRLFSTTAERFGGVDVLVNNAGSFPNAEILDMTLGDWRAMYRDNVETVFLCTQAAARQMKERHGGSIINIASIAGTNPGPAHAHYNSAKAAVIMFTMSAAQEFGPHNIRVNALSPGVVDRPGIRDAWPDGVERFTRAAPLSRLASPDDIAAACLFLSSDGARYLTGANIPVDGGILSSPIY